MRRSLRTKAWIATLAILAYVIASFAWIAVERSRIQDSVASLETLSGHAKALALASAALDGAIVDVNEASSAGSDAPMHLSELAQYMETCERLFQSLAPFDPAYERMLRGIVRSYDALKEQPVRAQWIDLRETMARVSSDLDIRDRSLAAQRDELQDADAVVEQALADLGQPHLARGARQKAHAQTPPAPARSPRTSCCAKPARRSPSRRSIPASTSAPTASTTTRSTRRVRCR